MRSYCHQWGGIAREVTDLGLTMLSFSSRGLAETPGGMLRNWSREMKGKWMRFVPQQNSGDVGFHVYLKVTFAHSFLHSY